MRVRVRDRSAEAPWGVGLTSPAVRTIEIADTCPKCAGEYMEQRNAREEVQP